LPTQFWWLLTNLAGWKVGRSFGESFEDISEDLFGDISGDLLGALNNFQYFRESFEL
jgi:hypothetical protein